MARAKRGEVGTAATGIQEIACGLLAIPVFPEDFEDGGQLALAALDRTLGGALFAAVKAERFEAKPEQQLLLPTLGRGKAERILLLGMGARGAAALRWPACGFEPLRAAAGVAARAAVKARARTLAFAVPVAKGEIAPAARAAVEGALLGLYRFDAYKAPEGDEVEGLALALPPGAEGDPSVGEAIRLGVSLAEAICWARDLVNLGPADCTPARLADAARALAREAGLRCEVQGPKQIEALKMGMFLGVTRGSAEPPRLVKLSWIPKGAGARRPPLVLVGKALTFDSGGLSLKPADSMPTMHTDMAGAAAVVAAMKVIAELAPPFPVHAVFGACENMPGGRAYKPSDVLRAFDGKTVEITNTDAEGRLVLGDVLAWAARTLSPAAMVDVATLTGACMVALGMTTAGLFGPDGPVVEGVAAAAREGGEEVWRLPLTESIKDNLKSDRADLKNSGDRMGSAIAAAHFLQAFAGETPWAHLDIAGPSHSPKEYGYVVKGGTGFGVRTLVELVRSWR
ncbi:MAG TPA: leucyl aminopeptidase [Anaeromyxobacteraceae bacterium]|nr:leucyl aminopeptidase [Anaeromyxobacteraceae bacterium]